MAKDAKGHGSEKRGGGEVQKPVPGFVGRAAGYELAHRPGLYAHLGLTDQQSAQQISDKNAAAALSQGAPPSKAGPAPVHSGANGRADILAKQIAFTKAAGSDMTPTQRDWLAKNDPASRKLPK